MPFHWRDLATLAGVLCGAICLTSFTATANGMCRIVQSKSFGDGPVTVLLVQEAAKPSASFAVFKAPLAVNTDGAPTSYHPRDFFGDTLAIDRIDNGIAIERTDGKKASVSEKKAAFEAWRDSDFGTTPEGFRFNWKDVIAADETGKPCVFKKKNAGYFGSLTALKNGLPKDHRGECEAADQLDQRFIPSIVLRGGSKNPLIGYGAKVGDLVLAINPESGTTVGAIIGDSGNGNRIGEGSIALNMALLGIKEQPHNHAEADALDTGKTEMVIAVIPASKGFQLQRPYSVANISSRVQSWVQSKLGLSLENFADLAKKCATK